MHFIRANIIVKIKTQKHITWFFQKGMHSLNPVIVSPLTSAKVYSRFELSWSCVSDGEMRWTNFPAMQKDSTQFQQTLIKDHPKSVLSFMQQYKIGSDIDNKYSRHFWGMQHGRMSTFNRRQVITVFFC